MENIDPQMEEKIISGIRGKRRTLDAETGDTGFGLRMGKRAQLCGINISIIPTFLI